MWIVEDMRDAPMRAHGMFLDEETARAFAELTIPKYRQHITETDDIEDIIERCGLADRLVDCKVIR